jgi:hypothetical protein
VTSDKVWVWAVPAQSHFFTGLQSFKAGKQKKMALNLFKPQKKGSKRIELFSSFFSPNNAVSQQCSGTSWHNNCCAHCACSNN